LNNLEKFYNNFCSFLIFSFPFFLVTGPLLSEIAMFLLISFFIFEILKYKKINFLFKTKLTKLIIFFQLIIFISIINSDLNNFKLYKNFFYFRYFLFTLSVFYFLCKKPDIIKKTLFSFLFLILLLLFDSIFQVTFNFNLLGYELSKPNYQLRVSSFFGNELIMGSFVSRFLPLIIALIFMYGSNNKENKNFLITFFVSIISIVLILLSGERVAFFNILLFLTFLIIFDFKNIYKKKILIYTFLIFSILLFFNKTFSSRIINTSYNQIFLNLLHTNDKYDYNFKYFSTQHQAHAITAINIFKNNKFFGGGPQSFRYLCSEKKFEIEFGCSTHPHSTYLQILSEIGIFGFLIIFFLFLYLLKCLIRKFIKSNKSNVNHNDYASLCLITLFIINLFPLIPSGNFFNNWLSMVFYYPIGFYLFNEQRKLKTIKK